VPKHVGFVELKDAFVGHQRCSNDPYVFGLSIEATDFISALGINPSPFHPTAAGHSVIARLVSKEAQVLLKQ
jgi:lysophospholipase L1-like esterase